MRIFLLLLLFVVTGCATKYLVPANRFITPESQGGVFHGQVEIQQTKGNQLTIDTSNSTVDDGVSYSDITRTGFLASGSLFDSFDLVWSHMGAANSMIGGKLQVFGGSRTSNSTGHKAAVGLLFGGNEHETDDESVKFTLKGREYLFLYGYRISENIFPYAGLSLATYNFDGVISSSNASLNGLKPKFETTVRSLNTGVEFGYNSFFAKLEGTYQQLATTDTKNHTHFIFGYSIGYSW